ncbi:MAG: GH3 auxin-responsive promoter family protein [Bacteroidales bacterium]|nr:GH3 auxin-responsive promoter family protein [Bacteroidales bacterium]
MSLIPKLISWANFKRLEEIEFFKKNSVEVQKKQFFNLIEAAKDTFWGEKYEYNKILDDKTNAISIFHESVPLNFYEDLHPYIERVRSGEQNILWSTQIKYFAKSSGTTNDKSKYIPISQESLKECHFRSGKDFIAIYSKIYPDNKLVLGKSLAIGGSQQINTYDNNIFYGDLSAVLMSNLPFWANIVRTPNKAVALHPEWEEKIELIAQKTIKQNVTSMAGVPSWTLVLLKRILEITGKSDIMEVWPNLEVFLHGGVSFTPYVEQYHKVIDSSKMRYFETYNASEGFFAMQDEPDAEDMLLMLDYGIFYEFIPMSEFDDPNRKAVMINQVELNKNYALVISTNGGLWRYIIGDTVMFTSLKPYKIKITGRTKHFINAFGEELIVENSDIAIKKAAQATNAEVLEYTAAPVYMSDEKSGAHQWLIEFQKKPQNVEKFLKVLDDTLKLLNSDYESKRYKNITLGVPQLIVARKNLFFDWQKNNNKLGGQHKIPRLSNNRRIIESLLKYA